jgi:uncharacterized protein YegP (UPF0339 family)
MKLETYQDNGGRYHWRLVGADGMSLAGSTNTYASLDDARSAAQDVHDNASAMTIEGG